jgi:hypothetical protein
MQPGIDSSGDGEHVAGVACTSASDLSATNMSSAAQKHKRISVQIE